MIEKICEFLKGQKCKVVNVGELYSTYEQWAIDHHLKNWKKGRMFHHKKGTVFTIVAVGRHGDVSDRLLVAIKKGKEEFIFGLSGLETAGKKK